MQFTKPTLFSSLFIRRAVACCATGMALVSSSAPAGDLEGAVAPAVGEVGDVKVELELIRRQAMLEEAAELIRMGGVALDEGRAGDAMEAYDGVLDMLPDAPAARDLREQATGGYVKAALAHAEGLAAKGDLAGARRVVDGVLADQVAPGNPDALKLKQQLNHPVRHNPALTTGHVENVEKVVELLDLAHGAHDLGQFDRSKKYFEKVLVIDPYNKEARRGMEQIVKAKHLATAVDQTRAEMLMEVDKQWELPVLPAIDEVLPLPGEDGPGKAARLSVANKFDRIMIPQVAFDQVSLTEAVDFLRIVSMREDRIDTNPDTRGINFTINLSGMDEESKRQVLDTRFDLRLNDVPIRQVVKYITEITKTRYLVDDFSVVIRPPGSALDELISRTYQVPPDFITALSTGAADQTVDDPFAEPSSSSGGLLAARKSVQELLKDKGITFPDGAFASHTSSSGVLRVINTPQNHDKIEALVDIIKSAEPVAVQVQVTVLKVLEDNLREIGYDWLLGNHRFDGGDAALSGGTRGNSGGRLATDVPDIAGFTPADPTSSVENGLVTSGLRSGSQIFTSDTINDIMLNPNRNSQSVRVAPGILSVAGVFNDDQAQVIMRGLDQKTGVDMMANPSVVTRSHQSAKVLITREFIYPTEYDPPEVAGGLVSLVTPANPTAFETRNVGISLEVLPEADDEKNYINLTISPEIVEFDGFVNYGSPIMSGGSDGVITNVIVLPDGSLQFDFAPNSDPSQPLLLTENRILMPVFSTQRATTSLTIADGATIAYGGLLNSSIEKVHDKVPLLGSLPVLGRFFQTEAERPTRTAVIFFVKVQLMDPTGRPYRELSSR